MASLRAFFLNRFLRKTVKPVLDRLPLVNGGKTIIGVLILVFSVGAQVTPLIAPQWTGILQTVMEFLSQLPHETIELTGLGTMIFGLYHKWEKANDEKSELEKRLTQLRIDYNKLQSAKARKK